MAGSFNLPAVSPVQLRGNYAVAAADCTVAQEWERYSEDEHDVWRTLYERQIGLAERYGAREFLAGLATLGARSTRIPRFEEINGILQRITGWRLVAVPGLIPDRQFYDHLAARAFPVSVWIRRRDELDYLAEPDLFHDFFGHVPLLTDPVFARFMEAYGRAGPKAVAHGAVALLARVYWYTVEFGLLAAAGGLKAFGAGILSSRGETVYAVTSPKPRRLAFELERVMRTAYRIDDYQQTYFVLGSFTELFEAGYGTDFGPLYDRVLELPPIAPGDGLSTDREFGLAAPPRSQG